MVRDERQLSEEADFDGLLDRMEAAIAGGLPMECEVLHHFTPGLYTRECRFKAGTMGTSMEHATEHPFILAEGVVLVRDADGLQILSAPFVGITKPGTRRALYAVRDVVWITVHANPDDGQDVEAIGKRILAPRVNPLLPETPGQWRKSLPEP